MEFLFDGSFSSSHLLVVISFTLFATILLSSIYLRIRSQYRGRNRLPNHTRQGLLARFRKQNVDLQSIVPLDETVSTARLKGLVDPSDRERKPHLAEFGTTPTPTPVTANGAYANRISPHLDDKSSSSFLSNDVSESNGARFNDTIPLDKADSLYESAEESVLSNGEAINGSYAPDHTDVSIVDANHDHSASYDNGYQDEFDETTTNGQSEDSEYIEDFTEEDPDEQSESGYVAAAISNQNSESSEIDDLLDVEVESESDTLYETSDDAATSEGTESNSADEPELAFEHGLGQPKRADSSNEAENQSFATVSVCLISEDQGQVYRNVKGEQIGAFLKRLGFMYLEREQEYVRMQHRTTDDRSTLRARNFDQGSIGDLVKTNELTRGFRLYFYTAECVNLVKTLNDMMKLAHMARNCFGTPLAIYDGRKDSEGNIWPLTQEDYNLLKQNLIAAFPENQNETFKLVSSTSRDRELSDDLPSRAVNL